MKKLKNYNVLVKAFDNFSLVNLEVSVFRKGEKVFKKAKESVASGWPVPYLSFIEENSEPFTLKTNETSKSWNGTLEYSTNTSTWVVWNGTQISSSNDGKLYLRGTNNTVITGKAAKKSFVFTENKKIKCVGNIENLLNYKTVEQDRHPTMGVGCFEDMFKLCSSLTDVSKLELPATTLAERCYSGLFVGTSISKAPEFPATELAKQCYGFIFQNCASLTQAPELPATTLASYCYQNMFENCTSLISAPNLPATTLASYCYDNMFQGCTKLTTPPKLPATKLADGCYYNMFQGCTKLTTPPTLPATTLASECYRFMFYNCASLTIAPNLPATNLAFYCYSYMFHNCTKLTGQIRCAKSTSSNSYRLTSNDITGSKATIVFNL